MRSQRKAHDSTIKNLTVELSKVHKVPHNKFSKIKSNRSCRKGLNDLNQMLYKYDTRHQTRMANLETTRMQIQYGHSAYIALIIMAQFHTDKHKHFTYLNKYIGRY